MAAGLGSQRHLHRTIAILREPRAAYGMGVAYAYNIVHKVDQCADFHRETRD